MKYFEKTAFNTKDYIGVTLGTTVGGLSGYASSKKGKEIPNTLAGALYGGVLGSIGHSIVSNLRAASKISRNPEIARDYHNFSDPVIRESQEMLKKLKEQEEKIRKHKTTPGKFTYDDAMNFIRKKAAYKSWDPDYSFVENVVGGTAIGTATGAVSSTSTSKSIMKSLLNKKLLTAEQLKKIKSRPGMYTLLGGLFGGLMGLGKHEYEKDYYTS